MPLENANENNRNEQSIQDKGKRGFWGSLKDSPSTDEFIKGLWRDNPVFVQVLGCARPWPFQYRYKCLVWGCTAFVLLMSNILVSSCGISYPNRCDRFIHSDHRHFVTMTDYVIQAISVDLHKPGRFFISLIVVNCLILSRAEAFASKTPSASLFWMPWAWDWVHLRLVLPGRGQS